MIIPAGYEFPDKLRPGDQSFETRIQEFNDRYTNDVTPLMRVRVGRAMEVELNRGTISQLYYRQIYPYCIATEGRWIAESRLTRDRLVHVTLNLPNGGRLDMPIPYKQVGSISGLIGIWDLNAGIVRPWSTSVLNIYTEQKSITGYRSYQVQDLGLLASPHELVEKCRQEVSPAAGQVFLARPSTLNMGHIAKIGLSIPVVPAEVYNQSLDDVFAAHSDSFVGSLIKLAGLVGVSLAQKTLDSFRGEIEDRL